MDVQQYPSSPSEGCQLESTMSWTTPVTTPKPSEQSGTLEQKYDNLVVMFTKDACPFCRYMKPIMNQVEKKFGEDITFLYVDVVENPQYASQYGFSTVPHIVYFKDGKKLDSHGSGNKTMTVEQVQEKIEAHFGDVLSKD